MLVIFPFSFPTQYVYTMVLIRNYEPYHGHAPNDGPSGVMQPAACYQSSQPVPKKKTWLS
jgi:hypothetical protein